MCSAHPGVTSATWYQQRWGRGRRHCPALSRHPKPPGCRLLHRDPGVTSQGACCLSQDRNQAEAPHHRPVCHPRMQSIQKLVYLLSFCSMGHWSVSDTSVWATEVLESFGCQERDSPGPPCVCFPILDVNVMGKGAIRQQCQSLMGWATLWEALKYL